MSMVKPIVSSVNTFDATKNYTFTFVSEGGNQIVKNKIEIRNNDTSDVVYNNTIDSFKMEQTINSNTLTNGVYYNVRFYTYDINGTESPVSNVVPFWCLAEPILKFNNIIDGAILNTSNFDFEVEYSQSNSDLLDIANIIIYDSADIEIYNSGNIYNTQTPPLTFNYLFNGFDDNTIYKVKATAISVKGIYGESQIINFSTKYSTPEFYSILQLTNSCDNGYVELDNNMVLIDGSTTNTPIYIDGNKIDLRNDILQYNKGFSVNNDFTLRIWGENFSIGTLVTLNNDNGDSIEIKLIHDTFTNKYQLELKSNGYYIFSNEIDDISKCFIWVRRINNIYELKIEEVS